MPLGAAGLGAAVTAAQGQGLGQSSSFGVPGAAATAAAGFSQGPLPPGFGPLGYPGAIGVHPAVANQFPGTTLAEKIRLYQEKLRSREGEPVQPSLAASPISQGIGSLSPGPTTDASTFLDDAQQLSTSFGIPFQDAIISLATSRGLNPDQFLSTPDAGTFLDDAQQLSTSDGIPIRQAIISLAASRGLDPNQFLNVAPVGIGSITPPSTDPTITTG